MGKPASRDIGLPVLISLVVLVVVGASVLVIHEKLTAPWRVLKHARVTRVQVFDGQGKLEIDTGAQGNPIPASALEQISQMLATTDCSYSRVASRVVSRADAMAPEPGAALVDFNSETQSYRLRVDGGSTCRLQMNSDSRVNQFLTPRHKRLYDRIVRAVGSKNAEPPP